MDLPFELFIALRYLLARRKQAFISVISFTVLGLLGVTFVPLAVLVVLACAMFFTGAYGWAIERVAYRRLRGSFRLAPMISAIGMSIFLQNYVQVLQGARVKPLQPVIRVPPRQRLIQIAQYVHRVAE